MTRAYTRNGQTILIGASRGVSRRIAAPNTIPEGALYVAPIGASYPDPRDGTQARPYATVNDAVNAASAGQTIALMDGNHGTVDIFQFGRFFNPRIIIRAINPYQARIKRVFGQNGSYGAEFRDIWFYQDVGENLGQLAYTNGCSDFHFINCRFWGTIEAPNYNTWSQTDWDTYGRTAAFMNNSLNCSAVGCEVMGVRNAFAFANGSTITDNTVEGFWEDCAKVGDNSIISRNYFKNYYDKDFNEVGGGAHGDGIQLSALGVAKGYIENITIEGNTIIECEPGLVRPTDFAKSLQGIGCFDGFYHNLVVRNNVIVIDAAHGITIGGANDCIVANNTVVRPTYSSGSGQAEIRVTADKQGVTGTGNIIANNIAQAYQIATGGTAYTNYTYNLATLSTVLPGYSSYNLRPATDSGLLSGGTAAYAPATDIDGNARSATDPARGAYEVAYA